MKDKKLCFFFLENSPEILNFHNKIRSNEYLCVKIDNHRVIRNFFGMIKSFRLKIKMIRMACSVNSNPNVDV